MTAPALSLSVELNSTQTAKLAAIGDEQVFYSQARDYFDFWRLLLKQGHDTFGETLDPDWVITTLGYCNFGRDAVARKAPQEVLVFAKQLECCVMLGQMRGVFAKPIAHSA
ncbi:hypothetical protein HGA34_05435 [Candidatus Falkowbacteria bacterium]|nr:hypothetical protein [Candidatus Falkowbacteria bacterium]